MEIESLEIKRLLDKAASAPNTDAQGKAYEELAVYLFESIPGCYTEHDIMSEFQSEQVDVAVGNDKHVNGIPILPYVMLVECKDWSSPVNSTVVGYFINILANRSVELGILIAANGITGDRRSFTNAHALGPPGMARGIKVIVVTTAEIAQLTCTADFVGLLKRRFLLAVATGGIGIGPY
ncbi:restriction endonuclease [Mycobacterium haemophilum]